MRTNIKEAGSYWSNPGYLSLIATKVVVRFPELFVADYRPEFYFNIWSDHCMFAYSASQSFEYGTDPLPNWIHQLLVFISNGKNTLPLRKWWFLTFFDAQIIQHCQGELK